MRNKKKRGQAAFEYLSTYGWAILATLSAIGALAYFGFLNPSNLLPSKCDFGKQMECVEYRILSNGTVNLILRNNFGKDIEITDVTGNEIVSNDPESLVIPSGEKDTMSVILNLPPAAGDKKEVLMTITFKRDGDYPLHNVSGTVFVIVQ